MKKLIILLVFVVMITLSSCNYHQTAVDNLMSPPKLSEQQETIYRALENSVGKNIKLKYPQNGDFKSAFLIDDLDQEKTKEAIVFYEQSPNNSLINPLKINVLDIRNEKWVSVFEVSVNATEVDKVSFVKSDNKAFVIIGFNVDGQKEKMIKIYTYQNWMLDEVYTSRCNDFEVIDLDMDGKKEIVTLTTENVGENKTKSMANLFEVYSTGIKLISSTPMDPNVTEYINISHGIVDNGQAALYIDGVRGEGTTVTEILSFKDGQILNMLYKEGVDYESSLLAKTSRAQGTISIDVNNDLVYEIPNVAPIVGYEALTKSEQLNFTNWYNYKNNSLVLYQTSYVDYSLGFIMNIKQDWIGKITANFASNTNELVFYEYQNGMNIQNSNKIFSIRVVKRNDPNIETIKKEYQTLANYGQLMYMFKIDNYYNTLNIKVDDIFKSFSLL